MISALFFVVAIQVYSPWIPPQKSLYEYKIQSSKKYTQKWGENSWRREGDLNSRVSRTRDFQSRAIPGYAISAAARRQASHV